MEKSQYTVKKIIVPNIFGSDIIAIGKIGLNHQARDFVHAILLHLIDQLDTHDEFYTSIDNLSFYVLLPIDKGVLIVKY
jgi:hypothetical protein